MFNRNKIKELEEKLEDRDTKIHERDVFIGDIRNQNYYYQNNQKELLGRLEEKNTGIKQVIELTECNTYNNPNILMSKIKEILKAILEV